MILPSQTIPVCYKLALIVLFFEVLFYFYVIFFSDYIVQPLVKQISEM